MKKITILAALFMASVGFSQNLLSYGDIEGLTTGPLSSSSTPWSTANASNITSVQNTGIVHGGSGALNLPNDFTSFRQPFTAVVGTQYTLTFWNYFTGTQGQPASTDGIYVSIRQDTGNNGTVFSPAIQVYVQPDALYNTWQQYTLTFTATQTNLLLYVGKQARVVTSPAGPNNGARMDDFSIVTTPLSVRDLDKFSFKFYPNPAKDIINISADKNIDKVEIYNVLGQKVENRVLNSNNNSVNVSNLAKGTYVLKAFMDGSEGSYKFIKE